MDERRHTINILKLIALLLLVSGSAFAQSYPNSQFQPPPGGTVARRPASVAGDTINPLFYNPGGTPVDITGTTDAEPAINAAMVQACATTQAKTAILPPGVFRMDEWINLPANCSNLVIEGSAPGTVLIAGPTNTSAMELLQWTTGNDHITLQNLILDGGWPSTANNKGMVQVTGAARDPQFKNVTFRNSAGTGLWIVSGGRLFTTPMSAEANWGDQTVNFTGTLPTNIKVGAFLLTGEQDPDYYIQSLTSNTITFQKTLTDYFYTNTSLAFTSAFTLSATANVGATTLLTSDTNGLANQQTIYSGTSKCITRGTRIASFVVNTSVTLDQGLQCQITSGTGIAAELGIPNLLVEDSTFDNLGAGRANAGQATYTTAASVSSGSTISFNCLSGSGCFRIGPIPGNSAISGSANLPANDLVLTQSALNKSAGTFSLTFQNPVTGTIAAGTPILFTAGLPAGVGYAAWDAFGAFFGNYNHVFRRNRASHTWSSPFFPANLLAPVIEDNIFQLDRIEYQNAAGAAPSGCTGFITTISGIMRHNICSGTTGDGMDFNHTINTIVDGNEFFNTGYSALNFFGGRNVQFTNNTIIDAGQNANYAQSQLPGVFGGVSPGMNLSGSWTAGRLGVATGVTVSNLVSSDDQVTPTQTYGIVLGNHNSAIMSAVYGPLSLLGNSILPSDPALGITPIPPGVDNRIVNPCMNLNQRNALNAIIPGSSYGPDQWQVFSSPFSVKYQQDATAQGGCPNSLVMTVNTTVTPASGNFSYIDQPLETGDLLDLKYGSGIAQQVIVDFCAETSTAGTYGWGIQSHAAGLGLKSYASSYTTTGTTSQCFSFMVAGDTATSLNTGNPTTEGLSLSFDAGSGPNFYTASCNSWQTITANNNYFCNTSSLLNSLAPGQTIRISAVRFYPALTDSTWVALSGAPVPYTAYRYYAKTFPLSVVPAQNAGTSGALCSTYQNMLDNVAAGLISVPGIDWPYPTTMRIVPSIITFNTNAANVNWRDTTAGADVTATTNPDGSQDISQVLIGSAAVSPTSDNLCIQATANASF